ncbi:hypothetical protein HAX54_042776 [Datura stramonium]|uniref:BED-type domain-containing protein n=1 Tax=Datura stramonium TaxID=4076 RepID=A0ABS8W2E4_DATST|nr:hypothetical protein [Datura stramonium]
MDDESRVSDVGSTDNSIDTQTWDTKKRKEMQPRSGVWAHFDKAKRSAVQVQSCLLNLAHPFGNTSRLFQNNEEGREARCLRCGVIYNCDPELCGTTHLKKHVEKCLE